ncbi:MAG: AmmeMemoRadiSam system protein A [Acidobacteriia bacterium]|nr:AmmeMemoRadiSam system protein A [Terriglobia bacterium]
MDNSLPVLDESAQKELLVLTRATLESYFSTGQIPEYCAQHPALLERRGAFVSLHRGAELRGCIGLLSSEGELYRTVQRCALSAALEDSRFKPVTRHEVADLKIEISVLSPFERITDVHVIEVGRHGLIVSLGGLRGLLLPQVATKYDWDRETFLAQTCRKAGLPSNAWRQPNAAIQIFEAQVFSE